MIFFFYLIKCFFFLILTNFRYLLSVSERLSNLPSVPGGTPSAGANAPNNRRHLDKDDDNALFAL